MPLLFTSRALVLKCYPDVKEVEAVVMEVAEIKISDWDKARAI